MSGINFHGDRRFSPLVAALATPPLLAAVVTMLSGGGFSADAQTLFIALAGGAACVIAAIDPKAAIDGLRSPPAMALAALAALALLSVAWSIGLATDTLRAGLVIAGYAGMCVAGAALGRRAGATPIALAVMACALLEAVIGLRAVSLHALPDAERLARAWRPGGTFEYPPALAILEVGALPVLAFALLPRRHGAAAGAGAAAAVLAGAVLGLSDSRSALGLAVVCAVAMIARPPVAEQRSAAVATTVLALAGGLVAAPLLGGAGGRHAPAAGVAGLTELLAVAGGGGALWLLADRARRLRSSPWISGALAMAVVAGAVTAQLAGGAPARHRPLARAASARSARPARRDGLPPTAVLHGRLYEWQAALETWRDRPLLGSGAGTYYAASSRHQRIARSRFAHNLPLELLAELGVPGLILAIALYVSGALLLVRVPLADVWLLGPWVIAFLASNLIDWTWHLAGLGALWALAAGALAASRAGSTRAAETG